MDRILYGRPSVSTYLHVPVPLCESPGCSATAIKQGPEDLHVPMLGRQRGCRHAVEPGLTRVVVVDCPFRCRLPRVHPSPQQQLHRPGRAVLCGGVEWPHAAVRLVVGRRARLQQDPHLLFPVGEHAGVVEDREVRIVEDVCPGRPQLIRIHLLHLQVLPEQIPHQVWGAVLDSELHADGVVCTAELLQRIPSQAQYSRMQEDGPYPRHGNRGRG
mmetsp:Transcript_17404/g.52534  ORF Transcript_17404/g.52534 Transcript_17404/m.52534 type:complete len:215 (+) Transcript_17404:268-912(+)